jgi:hypothetical protein
VNAAIFVAIFSFHNHANLAKLAKKSLTLLRVPYIEPVNNRITLTISLSYAIIS